MKTISLITIRATQIASIILILSFFLFFFTYWKYLDNSFSNFERFINSGDLWGSIFAFLWILILAIAMIKLARTNRKKLDIFVNDLFFYRFKWIKIKSLRIRRILGIFSMLFLLSYLIISFSSIEVFFMDLRDSQDFNYGGSFVPLIIASFPFIINYLIYFIVKLIIWVRA